MVYLDVLIKKVFKQKINALKKSTGVFDLKIYYNYIIYIMPTNSKKTSPVKKTVTPVSATPEPVVVAPVVVAAPVVPKQKGGKKVSAVAEPVAPVVVAAPVAAPVAPKQKGGKKVSAVVEPVVVAPVEAVAQKGGAKAVKAAKAPKAPKAPKVAKATVTPKVAKVTKVAKAPKVVKTETDVEADGDEPSGVRSFKVRLPDYVDYKGRFTGLTPYQAANKALSKYFRENKTTKAEITFSIRESTRGSRRSTYTYNGQRIKLEVPVKYSIKNLQGESRDIVKEYKNKLTKVKKADVKEETLSA